MTEPAAEAEAATDEQAYRRHQLRQIAVLVTLPGLLLGSASIAAAYGSGLMNHETPTCEPVVVPAPKRGSFPMRVLNASGVNGAAASVARDLGRRGFRVEEASTAPRELFVRAPAAIYHGKAGLDSALLAAQQVKGAELREDGRPGRQIAFVLGTSFDGLVPAPPPKPPKPSAVTVNVYNTTYRSGLAAEVLKELQQRGFRKGKSGNDPLQRFLPDDIAVIRHGIDGDLAAKVLADHVPGAALEQDGRSGTRLDLVLGNEFATLRPVAEVPKRPVEPPAPAPTVVRPCTPQD